jgi:hypothetical protein
MVRKEEAAGTDFCIRIDEEQRERKVSRKITQYRSFKQYSNRRYIRATSWDRSRYAKAGDLRFPPKRVTKWHQKRKDVLKKQSTKKFRDLLNQFQLPKLSGKTFLL